MDSLTWIRMLAYSERPRPVVGRTNGGDARPRRLALAGGRLMDGAELQAKAIIAAALVASRAVEIPAIPESGNWMDDPAALRLRDLTDYLYQVLAAPAPSGS